MRAVIAGAPASPPKESAPSQAEADPDIQIHPMPEQPHHILQQLTEHIKVQLQSPAPASAG